MFYFETWHLVLLCIGLLIAGMLIWRSLHISCVNKRIQRETKYRRQRNHYITKGFRCAR